MKKMIKKKRLLEIFLLFGSLLSGLLKMGSYSVPWCAPNYVPAYFYTKMFFLHLSCGYTIIDAFCWLVIPSLVSCQFFFHLNTIIDVTQPAVVLLSSCVYLTHVIVNFPAVWRMFSFHIKVKFMISHIFF